MAAVTPTPSLQELNDYIENKLSQGILDNNFVGVRKGQTPEDPSFVQNTIQTFIERANETMSKLPDLLFSDNQHVDFHKVYDHAYILRGSSSSIGGAKVADASKKLLEEASKEAPEKEKCFEHFAELTHEYNTLRDCFTKIAEMEEIIRTST